MARTGRKVKGATGKLKSQSKKRLFENPITWSIIIGLLTLIILFPSVQNGFTNWDDDLYVLENNLVINSEKYAINDYFTTYIAGNIHPLAIYSLLIDYKLSELNPATYHWHSLILHIFNSIFVFLFIFLLTKRKLLPAIISALIFAIHPMHMESVAWIAERKDVLYTFYFILGLILYLKYLENKKLLYYLFTFIAFVLAVLSKSAAVVFPIVLILIDYYKGQFNIKSLLNKIPLILISIVFGIIALRSQADANALGDWQYFSFLDKIKLASYGFIIYIIKFFIPFKLSSFHPYPEAIGSLYTLSVILVIGIISTAIIYIKKIPYLFFGIVFYSITIALVLQFITVGNAIIAERYTYIPYIGLAFTIGVISSKIKNRKLVLGILAIFMIYLSVVTHNRIKVWENSETLWNDVIDKYPKEDAAFVNRGHYFRQMNKYDKALKDYNKAIGLNPKNHLAFSNRGKIYFDRNQADLAIADYTKSIELRDDFFETWSNRGAAFAMKGSYKKGLSDINRALEINPRHPNSLKNRALIWMNFKDYEKSILDFKKYMELKGENADIINSIAVCYLNLNDQKNAILQYNRAIQLKPNAGIFYANRAYCHYVMENTAMAKKDGAQALRLGADINPKVKELLN